ncbi:MAG: HesA/MoeB/ThiF family protein [Deltaproteobacteria bacterium]|nr:MAG: HesA/MoeB/ThiF family protein [Deltaproteobacteria bacterium]
MEFTDRDVLRYSRNILLREFGPEGQEKLLSASALVVGAGGLGSPALLYLAAAGIGRLGIIDNDRVESSNLNRQVIHSEKSIGLHKVRSAAERLLELRPDLRVDAHEAALTAENAVDLFLRYDVVVDGSDNFPTKYLCSDASVLSGVPLVHGGALRFGGQLFTILPGRGPCLRCVMPEIPSRKDSPTCSESGILGAAAGVVGSWQAAEAIKVLIGWPAAAPGRILVLDTLSGETSSITAERNPGCPACGESPRIALPLSPEEYRLDRVCRM